MSLGAARSARSVHPLLGACIVGVRPSKRHYTYIHTYTDHIVSKSHLALCLLHEPLGALLDTRVGRLPHLDRNSFFYVLFISRQKADKRGSPGVLPAARGAGRAARRGLEDVV